MRVADQTRRREMRRLGCGDASWPRRCNADAHQHPIRGGCPPSVSMLRSLERATRSLSKHALSQRPTRPGKVRPHRRERASATFLMASYFPWCCGAATGLMCDARPDINLSERRRGSKSWNSARQAPSSMGQARRSTSFTASCAAARRECVSLGLSGGGLPVLSRSCFHIPLLGQMNAVAEATASELRNADSQTKHELLRISALDWCPFRVSAPRLLVISS